MTALALALFLAPSPAALQEAGAVFDAAVVVADEESRFEALVDLDGDGDQDVVGYWDATFSVPEVAGMLNDGAGGFEEVWRFEQELEAFGHVVDFDVGHLDGDGRGDFAIASEESIWLYRSQGALLPALIATISSLDFAITTFLLADFDGDGLDDVALGKYDAIEIWLNQGTGSPFVHSDSFPSEALNRPIFPVEANGDGKPDIMLEWAGVRVHHVADGKKIGGDLLPHDASGFGDWTYVAGDVDGDGDEDIAGFRPNGTYAVLERTGPDLFSAHPLGTGGPADLLADVDADGDLDGVRCAGSGEGTENGAWFEIATNDGSGSFAPPFAIEALGAHHVAGVDDVDADGDVDLVGGRVVYYADGPITRPVDQPVPPEYFGDTYPPVYQAVDFYDPDRDGDVDAMFGAEGYLRSFGDGKLAWTPSALPDPPGLKIVGPGYPGDWDGDGDLDLLADARPPGSTTAVHMRLLLNLGQGQLFDAGQATGDGVKFEPSLALPWDKAMFADDLDSDGDQDVLRGNDTLEIWWNGGGSFAKGPSYSGFPKAYADVNEDGIVDVFQRQGGLPALRLGQPGGAFGTAQLFTGSPDAEDWDPIAVADIDGDGDLDFATQSNRVVHLYWNDGSATFTLDALTLFEDPVTGENWELEPHTNYDRYLAAGDVDDDGDTDLVAGPIDGAENASLVFRKVGPGLFTASRQVLLATALIDMDADGDAEALGNRFVYGRTRETPADGYRLQYGAGHAGSCEVTPLLGASGSLRVGGRVTLHVSGVDAGMPGILAAGLQPSFLPDFPLAGITALTWPWIVHVPAPIPSGSGIHPGDGAATISFPVNPIWPNLGDLYHQAFYFSLAPCAESFAASSNGLVLRYAPALR